MKQARFDDNVGYNIYRFRCLGCRTWYGDEWVEYNHGHQDKDDDVPILTLEPCLHKAIKNASPKEAEVAFASTDQIDEKKELPVFPDILPSSIVESSFRNFESIDFMTKEAIDELIILLFEEPECSFYYFVEKGKGDDNSLLLKQKEMGSILMNETDFFYYRHPEHKRDFVKIEARDGNFRWDWEKAVVEKGPMFMRIKLRLSQKKRTELEILEKISIEDKLRKQRLLSENNYIENTNDSGSQKTPDGPWQVIFHILWPPNTLKKKALLGTTFLIFACFTVWVTLPDKTKTDIIDSLKDSIVKTNERANSKISPAQQVATAEPFRSEVFVEADNQGRISIKGGNEIVSLLQFCPEEWVDGCPNSLTIKRQRNIFELARTGLTEHQNAFNFKNAKGNWLMIPDRSRVYIGKNVNIKKGSIGSYFVYTGR